MSCHILLFHDSPNPTYCAGNTIEGKVVADFTRNEKIRSIRLKIRGREHTSWTKSESYYDSVSKKTKYRTVHYSGDNKFIQMDITLRGEGNMNRGRLEYPFKYLLPESAPSSYQGKNGNIWYYLKATIDIPWSSDYEATLNFNVTSPINFNTRAGLALNPVQYEDEKNLCCCCCSHGPITMTVNMDREAFVVGETMRIKVDITNMSNESINSLTAKLKMKVKENVTHPRHDSKTYTELIAALHESGVGAHGERTYNLDLVIPRETFIPNFDMASLFEKWCYLDIEASIEGCHSDMEITTAITLGHIGRPGMELIRNEAIDSQYESSAPPPPPAETSYPPDSEPPPYSSEEKYAPPPYPPANAASPPYPTEPVGFPMPRPGGSESFPVPQPRVGFNLPEIPAVHMPTPYPPAAGSSATAPPADSAPSAPSKAEMAEKGGTDDADWVDLDQPEQNGTGSELPPPDYHAAMKRGDVYPPPLPK